MVAAKPESFLNQRPSRVVIACRACNGAGWVLEVEHRLSVLSQEVSGVGLKLAPCPLTGCPVSGLLIDTFDVSEGSFRRATKPGDGEWIGSVVP